MSDTQTTLDTGLFDHFISACDHAAALIYHDVAAVEADVTQWRSDNPLVAKAFNTGVAYVKDLLELHGVPVAEGLVVVKTIGAALKLMASRDASVATVVAKAPVVELVAEPAAEQS